MHPFDFINGSPQGERNNNLTLTAFFAACIGCWAFVTICLNQNRKPHELTAEKTLSLEGITQECIELIENQKLEISLIHEAWHNVYTALYENQRAQQIQSKTIAFFPSFSNHKADEQTALLDNNMKWAAELNNLLQNYPSLDSINLSDRNELVRFIEDLKSHHGKTKILFEEYLADVYAKFNHPQNDFLIAK